MIKKYYAVFQIVFNLVYVYILYLFTKDKKKGCLRAKARFASGINKVISKYFFNNINIDGTISKSMSNKLNLLISNHISMIDFLIIITILHQFNIDNWYFVFKDSILKVPIVGSILRYDIRITRNWDNDQQLIEKQLNEIDNGTIVIYPEGTRYTTKKHIESRKFCIDNKLPIYNYTLAPKAKGFHCMFKILFNSDRLGDINDMTLILPSCINKNLYLSSILSGLDLGNLEIIIKKLKFNKNDLDYEKFKKKLYDYWLYKNVLIEKKLKI